MTMLSYTLEEITHEAGKLRSFWGCSDPVRICRNLGILLMYHPLGTCEGSCKGYFLTACKMKAIIVNNALSEQEQRIIIAHELGHATLHSKAAESHDFHEFSLLDEADIMEYEANVFAAELLIDEGTLIESIKDGLTCDQLAASFNVPYELLAFKMRVLQRKGFSISELPVYAHGNFLKGSIYKEDAYGI